jgi:hypothetical protein
MFTIPYLSHVWNGSIFLFIPEFFFGGGGGGGAIGNTTKCDLQQEGLLTEAEGKL